MEYLDALIAYNPQEHQLSAQNARKVTQSDLLGLVLLAPLAANSVIPRICALNVAKDSL